MLFAGSLCRQEVMLVLLAVLSPTWVAASPGEGGSGGADAVLDARLDAGLGGGSAALAEACRGRLEVDAALVSGRLLPGAGCAALPGDVEELWERYYAPGVLENATEDAGLYRRLLVGRFMALHPVRTWVEVGPFTPADLDVVHDHWLGFPPQKAYIHYTLAAAYTVIMTLGVFGNLLVLYMFCRWVASCYVPSVCRRQCGLRCRSAACREAYVSLEGAARRDSRLGSRLSTSRPRRARRHSHRRLLDLREQKTKSGDWCRGGWGWIWSAQGARRVERGEALCSRRGTVAEGISIN